MVVQNRLAVLSKHLYIPIAVTSTVVMLTEVTTLDVPFLSTVKLTNPASRVVLYTIGLNPTCTVITGEK